MKVKVWEARKELEKLMEQLDNMNQEETIWLEALAETAEELLDFQYSGIIREGQKLDADLAEKVIDLYACAQTWADYSDVNNTITSCFENANNGVLHIIPDEMLSDEYLQERRDNEENTDDEDED